MSLLALWHIVVSWIDIEIYQQISFQMDYYVVKWHTITENMMLCGTKLLFYN